MRPTDMMTPLTHLHAYITEGCNLTCRHCCLGPRFVPSNRGCVMLDVEAFETALLEARPLGLKEVKLGGGEPLIHPQFLRLLEIVRRHELGVHIETNGLEMTPALAAEIARNPARRVGVNLDGAEAATHDWVSGVWGSFTAATRAIHLLAEAGIRPQIIFSVLRQNSSQAEAVVKLAERLGAGSVRFNLVLPMRCHDQSRPIDEALGIAELIHLGQTLERETAAAARIRIQYDYPPAFHPLARMSADGNTRCEVLETLGLLPGGEYTLCGIVEATPELIFGQVAKDPLERVWKHTPLLKALHWGLPKSMEGICADCRLKMTCLGHCIAHTYSRTGNLWAPYGFCEEANRIGLFPAWRKR